LVKPSKYLYQKVMPGSPFAGKPWFNALVFISSRIDPFDRQAEVGRERKGKFFDRIESRQVESHDRICSSPSDQCTSRRG
jgi:hypothetical protein